MNKKTLKTVLKWCILGGVFFFLLQALRSNWQDIASIRITAAGWSCVVGATGMTLLAHIWSGWVWGWILAELNQSHASGSWSVLTYLKTNIAKYLPGNIWHFYGRVMTAKTLDIPIEASTVSVIMEALLMAIAALLVGLLSNQQLNRWLQLLALLIGLFSVHPRVLNPILKHLKAGKIKSLLQLKIPPPSLNPQPSTLNPQPSTLNPPPPSLPPPPLKTQNSKLKTQNSPPHLNRYPFIPLMGELGFLGLRSLGFVGVLMALTPIALDQLPAILSGFSLAWMLGLVIPGAPGGIGVFEATAIALLTQSTPLSTGIILSAVALYRLVSTLAEAIGAGTAWLDERHSNP